MSGFVPLAWAGGVAIAFLGVVLVLGLALTFRARKEDIPALARAFGSWLRWWSPFK
jgi:hypothetical protein